MQYVNLETHKKYFVSNKYLVLFYTLTLEKLWGLSTPSLSLSLGHYGLILCIQVMGDTTWILMVIFHIFKNLNVYFNVNSTLGPHYKLVLPSKVHIITHTGKTQYQETVFTLTYFIFLPENMHFWLPCQTGYKLWLILI